MGVNNSGNNDKFLYECFQNKKIFNNIVSNPAIRNIMQDVDEYKTIFQQSNHGRIIKSTRLR